MSDLIGYVYCYKTKEQRDDTVTIHFPSGVSFDSEEIKRLVRKENAGKIKDLVVQAIFKGDYETFVTTLEEIERYFHHALKEETPEERKFQEISYQERIEQVPEYSVSFEEYRFWYLLGDFLWDNAQCHNIDDVYIAFFARHFGISEEQARDRIDKINEFLELAHERDLQSILN